MHKYDPYVSINGFEFGCSISKFKELIILKPVQETTLRNGVIALEFQDAIYRFNSNGLCEVTTIDNQPIEIEGQVIYSIRDWLPKHDSDTLDKYGFRVSKKYGIAVDLDDEKIEYTSFFVKGYWDN